MDVLYDDPELVPVDDVLPKPGNARQHDLDDLTDSLRTHAQYRPITVNRRTKHIVKGNGTWKAAKQLGATHIGVVWVDVDDVEETRYTVVDNKSTELGWMNDSSLLSALGKLQDTEAGLAGTGYVPTDVEWLEKSLAPSSIGLPTQPPRDGEPSDVPGLRPGYAESEMRQLVLVVHGGKYDQFLADLDSLALPGENVALVVKRLVLSAAGGA